MIKLTVLYPTPSDPAAFDAYYHGTHAGLAAQIPGLERMELARGLSMIDGTPPEHHLIAELYFADMAAFQAGLGSPQGQATAGDVPNFATGGVTMQLCEVLD
ncbi:EthD family reductase [Deinococcus koreensis]|uniref:EthD family reductase n=1 Tax=Deinococcus koreensis TaxID=2054903 RepID=A0A2K3UXL3_9DEIO|nr:EthD family reductase [Deinococcus koreensis]PNY81266.1 EthD family reductase [Deinococcus koreensis]